MIPRYNPSQIDAPGLEISELLDIYKDAPTENRNMGQVGATLPNANPNMMKDQQVEEDNHYYYDSNVGIHALENFNCN